MFHGSVFSLTGRYEATLHLPSPCVHGCPHPRAKGFGNISASCRCSFPGVRNLRIRTVCSWIGVIYHLGDPLDLHGWQIEPRIVNPFKSIWTIHRHDTQLIDIQDYVDHANDFECYGKGPEEHKPHKANIVEMMAVLISSCLPEQPCDDRGLRFRSRICHCAGRKGTWTRGRNVTKPFCSGVRTAVHARARRVESCLVSACQ